MVLTIMIFININRQSVEIIKTNTISNITSKTLQILLMVSIVVVFFIR